MDEDTRACARHMLIRHEGLRLLPYEDNSGHLTIGIGRNLSGRGISQAEAYSMLEDDINYFIDALTTNLPFFKTLDNIRQVVLIDMCFNLGLKGLFKFKDFLSCVANQRYKDANTAMLQSLWAHQVPSRAKELAEIMLTGGIKDVQC